MWDNTAQFSISWLKAGADQKLLRLFRESTALVLSTKTFSLFFFFFPLWMDSMKHMIMYHKKAFTIWGVQAPRQAPKTNSFPGSLRLKPSQCVSHVSALALILTHHGGFPENALAKADSPPALPAPDTSHAPTCRRQRHSPGGGVPPGGKLALILTGSFSRSKLQSWRCS